MLRDDPLPDDIQVGCENVHASKMPLNFASAKAVAAQVFSDDELAIVNAIRTAPPSRIDKLMRAIEEAKAPLPVIDLSLTDLAADRPTLYDNGTWYAHIWNSVSNHREIIASVSANTEQECKWRADWLVRSLNEYRRACGVQEESQWAAKRFGTGD